MTRRAWPYAALFLAAAVAIVPAAQQLTSREADSLQTKLSAIIKRGAAPKPVKAPPLVRTAVSEREINAYLKFNIKEQLPKGVAAPEVTLVGDRQVAGHALVDLDAVRTAKERNWLDPAAYLTGVVDVKATGRLRTAEGKATFLLESASLGAVPLPKSLFQELVNYYSRSPELPGGFDLDKPFDLPASIREIEIQRGAATIIQ